jgi:quercetin dioxygenase-like cupin family protein
VVTIRGKYKLVVISDESTSAPTSANAIEVLRLVEAMCDLQACSEPGRSRTFFERCAKDPSESAITVNADQHAQRARLAGQEPRFADLLNGYTYPIRFTELPLMEECFNINRLLFYPLLSTLEQGPLILLSLDRDFHNPERRMQMQKHEMGLLGRNRDYATPTRRLEGADATFVRLLLGGKGASANHEHPGDELMLVLEGQVEVRFEANGMRTVMNKGDLVHFYAEQRHQVFNLGAHPAELFIVRFYQFNSPKGFDSRQDVWRAVDWLLTDSSSRRPDDSGLRIMEHARHWIRECIPHYSLSVPSRDYLGLSRFLQQWCRWKKFAPLPAGLERDLTTLGPDALAKLEWSDLLQGFPKLLGVDRFLLEGFASPAVPNVVLVREQDFTGKDSQSGTGIDYALPHRNLSCSDISIARVTQSAGSWGPRNSHPGLEAILCLEGSLTVEVDDADAAEVGPRCLCHFDSTVPHRVGNTGDRDATYFVIRFFRDGLLRRAGNINPLDGKEEQEASPCPPAGAS